MRESLIESYLVRSVESVGGIAYKFVSPGRRGAPDRMVLLPGGVIVFVEVKATGMLPKSHQAREHTRMRELGQTVLVLDSLQAIDGWLSS